MTYYDHVYTPQSTTAAEVLGWEEKRNHDTQFLDLVNGDSPVAKLMFGNVVRVQGDWLTLEPEALADLLALIARTPSLLWVLVSSTYCLLLWPERLGRAAAINSDLRHMGAMWATHQEPPPNVFLLAKASTQQEADERVPELLRIPAAGRGLLLEGLSEAVGLFWPITLFPDGPLLCCGGSDCGCMGLPVEPWLCYGLDLVGVAGQSGHEARPLHPSWVRGIRDQCAEAVVGFCFEGWGGRRPMELEDVGTIMKEHEGWVCFPEDPEFPHIGEGMVRVGSEASGRLLDGVTHGSRPEVGR